MFVCSGRCRHPRRHGFLCDNDATCRSFPCLSFHVRVPRGQNLVSELEEKVEELQEEAGSSANRKKLDQEVADLKTRLEKHQWHLDQLQVATEKLQVGP